MVKMIRPFNPGRFADALAEKLYPRGWGKSLKPKRERERRARLLRKGKTPKALNLAALLDGCTRGARCQSGACSECTHAAQTLYTQMLRNFLNSHGGSRTLTMVTIILPALIPPGTLSKAEHQRAAERLKYALRAAGVPWLVGGVDLSFNEHATGRYPRGWSWHVHGFVATKNIAKLKKRLKRRFPPTDAVPRPVKVVKWDGRSAALEYTFKNDFERRVGRDDGVRRMAFGRKRTCRVTEKQRLRSHEKRDLLLHLHEIGLQGRLLFRCAQFQNSGTPKIVLRKR
jgi:hypothetical protein